MSHIRRIGLMCLMSLLAQFAKADVSSEIFEASTPIAEGVPEVALMRLQALLNNNLPEVEWRAVVEKLAKAQIAAKQPENTLILLDDIRVHPKRYLSFSVFGKRDKGNYITAPLIDDTLKFLPTVDTMKVAKKANE